MYRILHNDTPSYLTDVINPYINDNENQRYPLRRQRILNTPLCHTENYQTSFFPSMINEINLLEPHIINAPTVQTFKKIINTPNDIPDQDNNTVEIFKTNGCRKINIILCQLRNECSNLNYDLYRDHLNDTPACRCGNEYESAQHYIMYCPLYTEQRQILITSINNPFYFTTEILLNGCNVSDNEINKHLLYCITKLIEDTKRLV